MKTSATTRLLLAGLLLSSAATAPADLITFQVNMGVQQAMGNFNPSTMNVECRGGFQSPTMWTGGFALTNSGPDPNVYIGTYNVTNTVSPNSISYKFTFNSGTYELQGLGNRTLQLNGSPQTVPVVYFDNVTNAYTNDVTFQVDMTQQIALGTFNPLSDYATVAGGFLLLPNGAWDAATDVLYNNGNNVYTNTFQVVNGLGKAVSYKFTIDGGGTWEGNVGTGGNQNRVFTFTNSPNPLVLPAVFFNNFAGHPITNSVTFQVNMGVQVADGTNFDPSLGSTVSVAGDFQNPAWNVANGLLTDNGSNVWYGTFDVIGSSNVTTTVAYQFVAAGLYENQLYGTGNRTFSFLATGNTNQVLPIVFFGNASDLGPITFGPISGGHIPLSWNPGTHIRLQQASSLAGNLWTDVANSEGLSATNVPVGAGAQFFRLIGP